MSVGDLYTHLQENLCSNPNSVRKRYAHVVFYIVGLKVNPMTIYLEFECMTPMWTHQFKVKPIHGR